MFNHFPEVPEGDKFIDDDLGAKKTGDFTSILHLNSHQRRQRPEHIGTDELKG